MKPKDTPKLRTHVAPRLRQGMKAGILRASTMLETALRESFTKGARYKSAPPGLPPNIQRGQLRRSITTVVWPGGYSAKVGTNLTQARLLERGGLVLTKGKLLPVPLNPQARRINELGGPRTIDAFPIRTRKGTILLVGKKEMRLRTPGQKIPAAAPRWVLKRGVRIRPHPWMGPTEARLRPRMHAAIREEITAALKR